jgi:cell division protein FtsW
MGGSSLLFTCISIGIILSVSRNVEQAEGDKWALATQQVEEEVNEYTTQDGQEEEV